MGRASGRVAGGGSQSAGDVVAERLAVHRGAFLRTGAAGLLALSARPAVPPGGDVCRRHPAAVSADHLAAERGAASGVFADARGLRPRLGDLRGEPARSGGNLALAGWGGALGRRRDRTGGGFRPAATDAAAAGSTRGATAMRGDSGAAQEPAVSARRM